MSMKLNDHQCGYSSVFLFKQNLVRRKLRNNTFKNHCYLLESIPQGLILLDTTGTVTLVNQAAEELLGVSRSNILGRNFVDCWPKVIRQDGSDFSYAQQPALLALFAAKPIKDTVIGLFNVEQQNYVWVVARIVPEFGLGQSKLNIALISIPDIAPLKLIEAKLSLASDVLNNIGEGIFIADKDQKIISVNDTFSILTGFKELEVLGKSIQYLQSKKNGSKINNQLTNNKKVNAIWQGELWLRHKYRRDFPTWTTISEAKDSSGTTTHYIYGFIDITEFKKNQDQLIFLAYHDPLTKLTNRLLLKDRITHSLQIAHREGSQVAILFMDLDRFKPVNDTYGHAVGDNLLKAVAKRIENLVRKEDTVSRYAGDEFVVCMEKVSDVKKPAKLAQKLIDKLNRPFDINGIPLQISTSIGISLFPQDGFDAETLIVNADAAMYLAKKEGRNNYQYFRTIGYAEERSASFACHKGQTNG